MGYHSHRITLSVNLPYLRLIDLSITQLKAQGPSRTCNDSNEEEEEQASRCSPAWPQVRIQLLHRSVQQFRGGLVFKAHTVCITQL